MNRVKGTRRKTVYDVISNYPERVQHVTWVISALPVTQISVERLFSALKILLIDARSRLKADLVKAILFLRTNSKSV